MIMSANWVRISKSRTVLIMRCDSYLRGQQIAAINEGIGYTPVCPRCIYGDCAHRKLSHPKGAVGRWSEPLN